MPQAPDSEAWRAARSVPLRTYQLYSGCPSIDNSGMAVIVWLTSGGRRVIPEADSAETDGPFVKFNAPVGIRSEQRTVLMLKASDVDHVDLEKDGKITTVIPSRSA